MVQMIFLKLNSINKYINKIAIIVLLIALFELSACNNDSREYPKPSREFYVNDYANAFHPLTKDLIVIEGEDLYEDTKDIEVIGGTQIVFASFLVESVDDITRYNKTDIFREWKIGKNDMGILVLFYFTEGVEDGIEYIYLEETEFEVGYRMEQYLTAGEQGRLLDNTVYGDTYDDLDTNITYLYYEILTLVYEKVYSDYYESFTYDLDYYIEKKDGYHSSLGSSFWSFAWLIIFFTGSANGIWYAIVPIVFLALGGGIFIKRNRGGGGSSGGYGIFRRR